MPTTKARKVYQLFMGPGGITTKSTHYPLWGKTIYTVSAYSAKQALFLANRLEWYSVGKTGILAITNGGDNVKTWDGGRMRWSHGKTFKEGN